MGNKRADVLASSCVYLRISIYCICLQALVNRCRRPLQQVPTRNTFLALYNHMPLFAGLQVGCDETALSRGMRAVRDQGRRAGQTRLFASVSPCLRCCRSKILTDKTALSWRSCCSLHGQCSFNPSSVDSSSSGCIPLPCS